MNNDSGLTTTVWMETTSFPSFQSLDHCVQTEVCVVGAGISGLTTAYLLLKEGRKVIVIDDGPVAGGETSRTTAHLAYAFDDRFYELERIHGQEGTRLTAESHRSAIDLIERIVEQEGIDCDFERLDAYLFALPGHDVSELDRELEAAHRAGLTQVAKVDGTPVDTFNHSYALRFPDHGQFHVFKYLRGVVEAIVRMGGELYESTRAEKINGGEGAHVMTSQGFTIHADHIVVATNSPVNDRVTMHTKQAAYRSYVIAVRVPRGSVPQALYWDTADPYHYVRIKKADVGSSTEDAYDLLLVGGEDHKTGEEDNLQARFVYLEEWTREFFPVAGEVMHR